MWGTSPMQPAARDGSQRPRPVVSTMEAPIQKCPELIPGSPGAYDGRAKWAAVAVLGGSVGADSVTTPS